MDLAHVLAQEARRSSESAPEHDHVRMGTIAAPVTAGAGLNVWVGSAPADTENTLTTGVSYLGSYTPVVGDKVVLWRLTDAQYLVIGKLAR